MYKTATYTGFINRCSQHGITDPGQVQYLMKVAVDMQKQGFNIGDYMTPVQLNAAIGALGGAGLGAGIGGLTGGWQGAGLGALGGGLAGGLGGYYGTQYGYIPELFQTEPEKPRYDVRGKLIGGKALVKKINKARAKQKIKAKELKRIQQEKQFFESLSPMEQVDVMGGGAVSSTILEREPDVENGELQRSYLNRGYLDSLPTMEQEQEQEQ